MPTATRSDRRSAPVGRPSGPAALAAVVALAATSVLALVGPASASGVVAPRSIVLAGSATCAFGDVDISYAADGISRQEAAFTSQTGAVLDQFTSDAYRSSYDGTEHILTQAGVERDGVRGAPAPPAGTVVGVYVTLGEAPPAATNGEFFVLYRCDTTRNDRGGANEVLSTCVGAQGTCPQTAQQALAPATTAPTTASTVGTTPTATRPVTAIPRFTG
jgi:hypothetical protein